MAQLLSLANQVLDNQPKDYGLKKFINVQSFVNSIIHVVLDLKKVWLRAKSKLAKYYSKNSHNE